MKRLVTILLLIVLGSSLFAASSSFSLATIEYQATIFDEVYSLFSRQLNMSFRSMRDNVVPSLLMALILLETMWVGTQAILQKNMSVPEIFTKIFLILLIVVITQNLDLIVKGLTQMFSKAAQVAGDSGNLYSNNLVISKYALFRPSEVTLSCKDMLTPLITVREMLSEYAQGLNFKLTQINNYVSLIVPIWIMQVMCWIVEIVLLVMISFVNVNVLMWCIEFSFLMVVASICLPWQIFSPTKFVASGIWQALFGQAIKLFCIVFMVSISPSLFRSSTSNTVVKIIEIIERTSDIENGRIPTESILSVIVLTIVLVMAYCYFLMKGPAVAKAIIVGQPTMETLGSHMVTRMGSRTMAFGSAAATVSSGLALRTALTTALKPFQKNDSDSTSGNNSNINGAKF